MAKPTVRRDPSAARGGFGGGHLDEDTQPEPGTGSTGDPTQPVVLEDTLMPDGRPTNPPEEMGDFRESLPPSFDQGQTISGMAAVVAPVQAKIMVETMGSGRAYGLYRVISRIGEGGFSTIHLATHTARGGEYALKLLRPELANDRSIVARFEGEARALVQIRHPNIVDLLDFGVTADRHYFLVTELVRGSVLTDIIAHHSPLGIDRAIDYGSQIARGLAAAHAQGFVHRDLKPDNVMAVTTESSDGESHRLKLLDFGLAIFAGAKEGRGFVGTPGYVAPEVIQGQGASPASDLYALGVLLYEMAVGYPPFEGELTTLLVQHCTAAVPATPELGRLEPLVMALLEKDPARRPSSAQQVLEALGAVQTRPQRAVMPPSFETDPASRPVVRLSPPAAPQRDHRILFAGLVAALVATAAVLAWALFRL